MPTATPTRSRRGVALAALAIGVLATAIFALVQAPLGAQSQSRVQVTFDGKRYAVDAGQLQQESDLGDRELTVRSASGKTRTIRAKGVISLEHLLEVAGVPKALNFVQL